MNIIYVSKFTFIHIFCIIRFSISMHIICMHVYVCVGVSAVCWVFARICMCVHVCTGYLVCCICLYVCVCVCVYVHIYIYTHACVCVWCIGWPVCVCMRMRCVRGYPVYRGCTCTYMYMYAYIYGYGGNKLPILSLRSMCLWSVTLRHSLKLEMEFL